MKNILYSIYSARAHPEQGLNLQPDILSEQNTVFSELHKDLCAE